MRPEGLWRFRGGSSRLGLSIRLAKEIWQRRPWGTKTSAARKSGRGTTFWPRLLFIPREICRQRGADNEVQEGSLSPSNVPTQGEAGGRAGPVVYGRWARIYWRCVFRFWEGTLVPVCKLSVGRLHICGARWRPGRQSRLTSNVQTLRRPRKVRLSQSSGYSLWCIACRDARVATSCMASRARASH
jgi:hypothetical protein